MNRTVMSTKLTRYSTNLRCLNKHFSTNNPLRPSVIIFQNSEIDPKKTADARFPLTFDFFPLPGRSTTIQHFQVATAPKVIPESFVGLSDVLTASSRDTVQLDVMKEFCVSNAEEGKDLPVSFSQIPFVELECVAHQCPQLLKKDFQDLFPNVKLNRMPVTVITLTQKTENDMSAWSVEMESERDKLTADFISIATQMCGFLKSSGMWADFIDPSSGRPYMGPFTNATLAETDERYRHLGYKIEDLGCCKVISHVIWGTKAFVGTIFTSAPLNSPKVKKLLDTVNNASVALPKASIADDTPMIE